MSKHDDLKQLHKEAVEAAQNHVGESAISDLEKRLRKWAVYGETPMPHDAQKVCVEAANRIAELEKELQNAKDEWRNEVEKISL